MPIRSLMTKGRATISAWTPPRLSGARSKDLSKDGGHGASSRQSPNLIAEATAVGRACGQSRSSCRALSLPKDGDGHSKRHFAQRSLADKGSGPPPHRGSLRQPILSSVPHCWDRRALGHLHVRRATTRRTLAPSLWMLACGLSCLQFTCLSRCAEGPPPLALILTRRITPCTRHPSSKSFHRRSTCRPCGVGPWRLHRTIVLPRLLARLSDGSARPAALAQCIRCILTPR